MTDKIGNSVMHQNETSASADSDLEA